MFKHRLAYRHDNGEVEGFEGVAFNKNMARYNAIREIKEKVWGLGKDFHPERLIESNEGLTPEETETIKTDWNTYL